MHVTYSSAQPSHRGTLEGFSALQILAQVGEFQINLVSSNKLKHFKKNVYEVWSHFYGRSWSSEKVVVYVGQYFPVSGWLWANVSPRERRELQPARNVCRGAMEPCGAQTTTSTNQRWHFKWARWWAGQWMIESGIHSSPWSLDVQSVSFATNFFTLFWVFFTLNLFCHCDDKKNCV